MSDDELEEAVRTAIKAHPQGAEAGPKAILDTLQPTDERFREMSLMKFKKLFSKVKVIMLQAKEMSVTGATQSQEKAAAPPAKSDGGYKADEVSAPVAAVFEDSEVVLTRPDKSQKFGMMFGTDRGDNGGHAITKIREGGVLHAWNEQNPSLAIKTDDVLMSVNGKTTFDDMMGEFGSSLSCTLKLSRRVVQDTKATNAGWEDRRARVTAALIPGLKKIIESEFGPGAGATIGRVERMYERIGSNNVFEEDGKLGKIYAPGYMENLQPQQPWHDLATYPWCAELSSQWKQIRTELRNCLDEKTPWTGGAYASSNEAYGADWKIMGVLTADKWQDEKKFKVTTEAVKAMAKHVEPFEAFFAKMPPGTKIAPHSDNLNYILTSHLALEVESGGGCRFKVGNEERPWKEGEMMVLDTSYIHSCVNESSRDRYVLVFRFWHPGLTKEELRAIKLSHAILAKASEKP